MTEPPQPGTSQDQTAQIDQTAQVSFMITLAQKEQLRQLGHDEAAINAMTPQDAHRILDLLI
jgi:hypothetical protein